ncbi:MAG: energy transducer TonB [Bacteroidota bacterium]
MTNKGWLYAFFIFLAQTCNPYYQAEYKNENEIYIPDEALGMDDVEMEPEFPIFDDTPIAVEEEPPPPPPPPPSAKIDGEIVFDIVAEMPRFPGCEQKAMGKQQLEQCAQEKMLNFVTENIQYPKIAKDNGIEGRCYLQFVIKKDGTVSNVQILRDVGGGCGREAVRVVNSMPKWIPGKHQGKSVNVRYTLPVLFKIPEEVMSEPPPPAPEMAPPQEMVFKVVEEMPRFPGCEDQGLNLADKQECANGKLLNFVYSNINYPAAARKNETSGTVILQWIIGKDGTLRDIKVIRDIGDGCGEEALRIIQAMPKWIPGKQRGRKVDVRYTFPIKFKLG